jgi:hypothetical protein
MVEMSAIGYALSLGGKEFLEVSFELLIEDTASFGDFES